MHPKIACDTQTCLSWYIAKLHPPFSSIVVPMRTVRLLLTLALLLIKIIKLTTNLAPMATVSNGYPR